MELFDTKEYKGFKTEFYVLGKTKKYLLDERIALKDLLPDTFHWYEHEVFDLLDPDLTSSWDPETETRRHFKVVLYGVLIRHPLLDSKHSDSQQLFDDVDRTFSDDNGFFEECGDVGELLSDGSISIHRKDKTPFLIRRKIFISN